MKTEFKSYKNDKLLVKGGDEIKLTLFEKILKIKNRAIKLAICVGFGYSFLDYLHDKMLQRLARDAILKEAFNSTTAKLITSIDGKTRRISS